MFLFILMLMVCDPVHAFEDEVLNEPVEVRDLGQDYEMFESTSQKDSQESTRSLVFGYTVQNSKQSVVDSFYNDHTAQQWSLSYLSADDDGSHLGLGLIYRSLFQHDLPYSWEVQNWGLCLDSVASLSEEFEETLGWYLRAKIGPQINVRYTRSSSNAGQARRMGYFVQGSLGKEIHILKKWNAMIEAQVQYMRSPLAKSLSYGVEMSLRVGI